MQGAGAESQEVPHEYTVAGPHPSLSLALEYTRMHVMAPGSSKVQSVQSNCLSQDSYVLLQIAQSGAGCDVRAIGSLLPRRQPCSYDACNAAVCAAYQTLMAVTADPSRQLCVRALKSTPGMSPAICASQSRGALNAIISRLGRAGCISACTLRAPARTAVAMAVQEMGCVM